MSMKMTKSEALAWRDRWKRVNEITILEARATTPDERLIELERLYDFALELGIAEEGKRVDEARARWLRLKEKARGR